MEDAGLRRQEVMGAVDAATEVVHFGWTGCFTVAALLAAGAAALEGPVQLTGDVALCQERPWATKTRQAASLPCTHAGMLCCSCSAAPARMLRRARVHRSRLSLVCDLLQCFRCALPCACPAGLRAARCLRCSRPLLRLSCSHMHPPSAYVRA